MGLGCVAHNQVWYQQSQPLVPLVLGGGPRWLSLRILRGKVSCSLVKLNLAAILRPSYVFTLWRVVLVFDFVALGQKQTSGHCMLHCFMDPRDAISEEGADAYARAGWSALEGTSGAVDACGHGKGSHSSGQAEEGHWHAQQALLQRQCQGRPFVFVASDGIKH